jgi:hypothetical protein
LFDGAYTEQADLVREILGNQISPYDALYASTFKKNTCIGSELCHISSGQNQDIQGQILYEITENVSRADQPDMRRASLYDVLSKRYGDTASQILRNVYDKVIRQDLEGLDAVNLTVLNLKRLSFLPDEMAMTLKELPELDDRIAARSNDDPLKFRLPDSDQGYRTFYPSDRGMLGFCEKAEQMLSDLGVKILHLSQCSNLEVHGTGLNISFQNKQTSKVISEDFDCLFWAGDVAGLATLIDSEVPLGEFNTSVPLSLFYFNVPNHIFSEVDYANNFDSDTLSFRISAPSKFGNGVTPEGMGYICVEVPTEIDSELWLEPEKYAEKIWSEVLRSPVVKEKIEFPGLAYTLKTPISYGLKKLGFSMHFEKFCTEYWGRNRVYFSRNPAFSKAHIFAELKNIIDQEL